MSMFSHLIQSFREGGPVMWPILILSVVGVAVVVGNYVLSKLFVFRKKKEEPSAE